MRKPTRESSCGFSHSSAATEMKLPWLCASTTTASATSVVDGSSSVHVPRWWRIRSRSDCTANCEYGGGTKGCTDRGQNDTTSHTTLTTRCRSRARSDWRAVVISTPARAISVRAPSREITSTQSSGRRVRRCAHARS